MSAPASLAALVLLLASGLACTGGNPVAKHPDAGPDHPARGSGPTDVWAADVGVSSDGAGSSDTNASDGVAQSDGANDVDAANDGAASSADAPRESASAADSAPDATPDAAPDAAPDLGRDSASDSSRDGPCDVGCKPTTQGAANCHAGEVQWICQGSGRDVMLFETNCRAAPTDSIRYCCPPPFLGMCQ
jgi:hypothetical protein